MEKSFEKRETRRHVISVGGKWEGGLTFVIKEAVLGEDEPPFLPEHQPLGSLFVQPSLKGHGGGEWPLGGGRS